MTAKLKLYRVLVLAGRDRLSDKGAKDLLELSRDPEVMAYYEKKDKKRGLQFERMERECV